jgi:phosphatidylglycerophosphate synthase
MTLPPSSLSICIVGNSPSTLWSLTLADRLRRQFARQGITAEVNEADMHHAASPVIVLRADAVIDQPLITTLIQTPDLILLEGKGGSGRTVAVHASPGQAVAAIDVINGTVLPNATNLDARAPEQIDAGFWKALRKKETPYALRVTPGNTADVEWRMFMGTYKGATDLVTKHVWPIPAFHATRALAPMGITPNTVTLVAAVATVAAFFLFLNGQFAWGLVAAWLMTFLDTVDGKLARTTLTSSKWGDVFDHGIDLVHPPFWYAAWALGVAATFKPWPDGVFTWLMVLIIGGYILQRVMEGIAIKLLGLEIHIWRKIDTYFRQITARRNPNLILLTVFTLVGRPDWGLVAVAAWTVICLVLHGLQLVQAFTARRRSPDGALQSWMSAP